ncbi:MAG: hypothetical protein LBI01_02240 [Elusimicrobium sp.]|jgi:hypothetical protein|nr:hypothetical protein [Elusimicrobium sp.]
MKRSLCVLAAVAFACGCGSHLRFRADVNREIAAGNFDAAASKIESQKGRFYREKDLTLFNLDLGAVQHDGGKPAESDLIFAQAQDRTQARVASVSLAAATVLKNDLTVEYDAKQYETSLTYVYRALNFMDRDDLQGALVEARKAVFFLDQQRRNKTRGYNDDPFVQYFASLIFESGGFLSDARIARTNSLNAYNNFVSFHNVPPPDFAVPQNAAQLGEIIFIHYNGFVPLLASRTVQIAWNNALLMLHSTDEVFSQEPAVQNALVAGFMGNAVTVAYPVVVWVPYFIRGSNLEVDGNAQPTVLMHDIAAFMRADLAERMPGIYARMIARAVIKQVLNNAARQAVTNGTKDENLGFLAGMVFSAFAAATERADTRLWFTLPGEIRMTRVFVPPGKHTMVFKAYDANGSLIETHDFGEIEIKAGERKYLHYRTGK